LFVSRDLVQDNVLCLTYKGCQETSSTMKGNYSLLKTRLHSLPYVDAGVG